MPQRIGWHANPDGSLLMRAPVAGSLSSTEIDSSTLVMDSAGLQPAAVGSAASGVRGARASRLCTLAHHKRTVVPGALLEQDGQTDASRVVDVGVKDGRCEAHLRRLEWEAFIKFYRQEEEATLICVTAWGGDVRCSRPDVLVLLGMLLALRAVDGWHSGTACDSDGVTHRACRPALAPQRSNQTNHRR